MQRRATASQEKAEKEVQKYTFFNEKLINESYASGDIYNKGTTGDNIQRWETLSIENRPYLAHIKTLSVTWPSLKLLADFMEIGTSPARWARMGQQPPSELENETKRRASRTSVTRLDYLSSGVVEKPYETSTQLKEALENEASETEASKGKFRLYIVEDLSRDVIELLGGHYDIEPAFFREQIFDYAWYNIRDRWYDSPQLNVTAKDQRWLQVRFPSIRYYESAEVFSQGLAEYEDFNVHRRPEDDINNKSVWDDESALVGIARSRASLWLSGEGGAGKTDGSIGILLCEPTPKSGRTLWYGYRNWEKTPSMSSEEAKAPKAPPRTSIYDDLVYWAKRTDAFRPTESHTRKLRIAESEHVPIQALLHLASAEWVEMSAYIRTRLGQIEWEISFPQHFVGKERKVSDILKKLHIWRRLVPLYREMLAETLNKAFEFPCQALNPGSGTSTESTAGRRVESSTATPTTNNTSDSNVASIPSLTTTDHHIEQSQHTQYTKPHANGTQEDFAQILGSMEEHQKRIDRLTSVVTAIISIQDSQTSREDNKNVARLTWLATFFVPLSFIASLFSMTEDISRIRETIKWFLATSLPLALLSLGMAMILTLPRVQKARRKYLKW